MARNGPRNWSVSAVRLLESCPQAFKFRHIDQIYPPRGDSPLHWRAGSVIHGGLEAAYKHRRRTHGHGPMMTDDVWAAAKEGIKEAWAEEEMPRPEESDGQWDRCHELVENVLVDQSQSWEDIVGVEEELFIRPGMNIKGSVDLLLLVEPGVYRARDWKSRKKKSTREELAVDLQGCLYGGMIWRKYPDATAVQFSHYYPPLSEEVVVDISREAGEAAISRLRAARDLAHHETEWPPHKSSACKDCVYRPQCPAWAEANGNEELVSQVDMF